MTKTNLYVFVFFKFNNSLMANSDVYPSKRGLSISVDSRVGSAFAYTYSTLSAVV